MSSLHLQIISSWSKSPVREGVKRKKILFNDKHISYAFLWLIPIESLLIPTTNLVTLCFTFVRTKFVH